MAPPALAQIKSCDALRDEIAAGLDGRGVQDYVLDIVPAEATGNGRVVGSCNGGASRIYYRRDGVVAPAPAEEAASAPAAPVAAASGTRKATAAAKAQAPAATKAGASAAAAAAPVAAEAPPSPAATAADSLEGNDLVDRWIEQIALSEIVFTTPQSVLQGEAAQVELTVKLDAAAEALRRQINAAARGDGTRTAGRQLHARLLGQQWRIAPLTPTEQPVDGGRAVRWQWEVTPLLDGPQRLHLSLSAAIGQGAFATPRTVRSFERSVAVETDRSRTVAPFLPPRETLLRWALLGVGGLVAFFGAGWWLTRRR